MLSDMQLRFFHTFGFLLLPGLLADDIGDISDAFDDVMNDPNSSGVNLDYSSGDRVMVPAIADLHPRLEALKSDTRILGIPDSILGPDWEYAQSAGDILECETTWHRDTYGSPLSQLSVKLLLYLDPLTRDTGAIRVMPGTNYYGDAYVQDVIRGHGFPDTMHEVFGVSAEQLPSTIVETQPGDVIALNFRTLHASFLGATTRRRLLNLNYKQPIKS